VLHEIDFLLKFFRLMQTLHLCVETNYLNRSYEGFSQCAKKTIVKLVQWFRGVRALTCSTT